MSFVWLCHKFCPFMGNFFHFDLYRIWTSAILEVFDRSCRLTNFYAKIILFRMYVTLAIGTFLTKLPKIRQLSRNYCWLALACWCNYYIYVRKVFNNTFILFECIKYAFYIVLNWDKVGKIYDIYKHL